MSGFFYYICLKQSAMAKFIKLSKTNEKGVRQEDERWNVNFIKSYRKWAVEGGKDLTVVYVEDTHAATKGRLIVDNSVEDIDNQIKSKSNE